MYTSGSPLGGSAHGTVLHGSLGDSWFRKEQGDGVNGLSPLSLSLSVPAMAHLSKPNTIPHTLSLSILAHELCPFSIVLL